MKDFKYLAANLLPALVWVGYAWGGAWAWLGVIFIFGFIPVVEQIWPGSAENLPEDLEESRSKRVFFDAMLWLNVPIVYASLWFYLEFLTKITPAGPSEIVGLTLGTGLICGSNGINAAHELGHRTDRFSQFLSKMLLLPSLYLHFFIEHNRGHHKHVGTDRDPASAKLGENLFSFWVRAVVGSYRSAWEISMGDLRKAALPFFSLKNEMLLFQIAEVGWLALVFFLFGKTGLIGAAAVAVIAFLLLETVNYIEHYGLRRKLLPSGKFEPVSPVHSWNSNHEIGRIMLYELTRHSDHHFKSTRKYQVLRHHDGSPQLPMGYPAAILLALVPPVWFRVMDGKVADWAARSVGANG